MPNTVVVFDSNTLIPLIIPASRSTRLFSRLNAAGWEIAASPHILLEVADKLRTKESLRKWLDLPDDTIELFLSETIMEMVTEVPGHRQTCRNKGNKGIEKPRLSGFSFTLLQSPLRAGF